MSASSVLAAGSQVLRWSGFEGRQLDDEPSSAVGGVIRRQAPTVLLDDVLTDVQSKA